jgi:hypothetical protein
MEATNMTQRAIENLATVILSNESFNYASALKYANEMADFYDGLVQEQYRGAALLIERASHPYDH